MLNAGQRVSDNNNRVQLSVVELIQDEMRILTFREFDRFDQLFKTSKHSKLLTYFEFRSCRDSPVSPGGHSE